MTDEPTEFEVLLKHVDRAGTRAVDASEEDAPPPAPPEKRLMKPEVVSDEQRELRRADAAASGPLILWGWLVGGFFVGLALTWWVTTTFY